VPDPNGKTRAAGGSNTLLGIPNLFGQGKANRPEVFFAVDPALPHVNANFKPHLARAGDAEGSVYTPSKLPYPWPFAGPCQDFRNSLTLTPRDYHRRMASNARIAPGLPVTRRWRRFEITVPVRVTVEKFRQVSVINSRGSQINAGGLALFSDTDLAIGDEAEIAVTDFHLTLRGVVRDSTGNQYGVKFLATSAEEAEQLGLFRQILRGKVGRLDA
jgi:hypothetical protein